MFKEECPSCGKKQLIVKYVEAQIWCDAPLYEDGFAVICHVKSMNTDSEEVKCCNCDEVYKLSELMEK